MSFVFVGDESVDFPILQAFESLGHEVLHIAKVAPGSDDTYVIKLARERNAILITSDKDFGHLVVAQKQPCRGVVLLRLFELQPAAMVERAVNALEEHGLQWENSFTVISPDQVRIRPLIRQVGLIEKPTDG